MLIVALHTEFCIDHLTKENWAFRVDLTSDISAAIAAVSDSTMDDSAKHQIIKRINDAKKQFDYRRELQDMERWCNKRGIDTK